MSVRYKVSEVWRNVVKGYNKVAGSWAKTDIIYVKQGGIWKVAAKRVPNVTGISYDTAQPTLTGLGFTVNKVNTNSSDSTYSSYPGGYVASQVPGIDELTDPGSSITLNTITYQVNAPSFGPYFFNPGFVGGGGVVPTVTPEPAPVTPTVSPVPAPSFYPGYFIPYGTGLIGYAYVSPPPAYQAPSFFGPSDTYYGGYTYGCLFGDTLVHTTKGLIKASELSIGDNLLSIDVEEIDISEEKSNVHYWLSGTFTIKQLTTTAINRITKVEVTDLVVINGESYSFDHILLVERDGEYEFIRAQFVKETDKILLLKGLSGPNIEFTPVDNIQREHYREGVTVYDLGVEPYDVYFTERMLSHNK